MRRLVAAVAAVLLSAVTLTACGSGDSSGPAADGSMPAKVIDITIQGDDISPNGQTYDVALGQTVELNVTADAPGEIHVHSKPDEQEYEYDKGSSTIELKPIKIPQEAEVESHTLEKTILTLEVK